MADPFVGSWEVTWGELTGGDPEPPDPFPFGPNGNVTISDQPELVLKVKTSTNEYPFPAQIQQTTPPQITASGDITRDGPVGRYNFLGIFVGNFPVERKLIIGAYTWNLLEQTPTDDPPATGGWVGGPESQTPRR